jgi:NAD(P)-dependent dehydrogenase (short-subunit alcohol dehydrogenase family)
MRFMFSSESLAKTLGGRRALVTGASRRLGRSIALALADAGVAIVAHYRNDERGAQETVRLARERGVRAESVAADLTHAEACPRIVRTATEALGGLDVLVNNASAFDRTPLDSLSVADWDTQMDANAKAPFELMLHAGRAMKAAGGGAIVNLACVSAERPWAEFVPYSASKAALVNATKGFAKALAPEVRVNAVAPGPILPPAGEDEAEGEKAVRNTLLKRWGHPDDIAAAVLFLLRASYVTGVVLHVDGGRSLV